LEWLTRNVGQPHAAEPTEDGDLEVRRERQLALLEVSLLANLINDDEADLDRFFVVREHLLRSLEAGDFDQMDFDALRMWTEGAALQVGGGRSPWASGSA